MLFGAHEHHTGIEPVLRLPLRTADGWQRDYSDDNPFV